MKNLIKFLKNMLGVAGIFFLLLQSPALAFNGAVLKGIKIDLTDNNLYRIVVKTDKDVSVKKYITDTNKIVLDLKNTKPADFVNTIYKNTPEIDHVIIQPSSGDNLRIFLQGPNLSSSKVILDSRDENLNFLNQQINTVKEEPVQSPLPVELTAPEKDIQPVNNIQNEIVNQVTNEPVKSESQVSTDSLNSSNRIFIDLSESNEASGNNDRIKLFSQPETSQEINKNNLDTVKSSMLSSSILEASPFDWMIRVMMLAVLIFSGVKIFTKPKNIEINLSSSTGLHRRESDLYKSIDVKKELITKSLGSSVKREGITKKANYNSISQYGLKEYKNNQLSPQRITNSMLDKDLNTYLRLNQKSSGLTAKNNINLQTVRNFDTNKISKNEEEVASQNFDSIKFLETMASIYQKSGRGDLASGIRQNLLRNK